MLYAGFPRLLESPGFFSLKFKDLESPGKSLWSGKSWKLKFKVLESPGKIVATRCHILRLKCTKFDFGAPDPALGELTVLSHTP